jgi:lipoic acid synthetase
VVDALVEAARTSLVFAGAAGERVIERQDASLCSVRAGANPANSAGPALRRLAAAGVDPVTGVEISDHKPPWLRVVASMGDEYLALRRTIRSLDLVTVCEEAGCPNIYECWADGTGTFMINGERCTRACGFCLVDTSRPRPLEESEPERVAAAVARMGLAHVVVTTVTRDDLADGGAGAVARTIRAIRERSPGTTVEVLISDCKGDEPALRVIFAAHPDVLGHNVETVLRLQRAVRPQASYARSLGVLAAAKAAGLVTKSGIMLGLGETEAEVDGALADLASIGVDIVTIGQYLRPSVHRLPVARWWTPDEFAAVRERALALGFAHVEASPLTRSSYHAREGAQAVRRVTAPA